MIADDITHRFGLDTRVAAASIAIAPIYVKKEGGKENSCDGQWASDSKAQEKKTFTFFVCLGFLFPRFFLSPSSGQLRFLFVFSLSNRPKEFFWLFWWAFSPVFFSFVFFSTDTSNSMCYSVVFAKAAVAFCVWMLTLSCFVFFTTMTKSACSEGIVASVVLGAAIAYVLWRNCKRFCKCPCKKTSRCICPVVCRVSSLFVYHVCIFFSQASFEQSLKDAKAALGSSVISATVGKELIKQPNTLVLVFLW